MLAIAPDPERGRKLSEARIVSLLRRGGRQRNLERRAGEIRTALRAPQLAAPPLVVEAQAANTVALVAVITTLNEQIARLEAELIEAFDRHPDAEILRSLPGLGDILGARVLAEFGDAPDRYVDAKARRNYAGTAPITRASGTSHVVVARLARNKRLFDATYQWAFCALTRVTGCPRLLRRPRSGTAHRQDRASQAGQQARRHPPWLPHPPDALRRGPGLASTVERLAA